MYILESSSDGIQEGELEKSERLSEISLIAITIAQAKMEETLN